MTERYRFSIFSATAGKLLRKAVMPATETSISLI
jgi:hypothetical protein